MRSALRPLVESPRSLSIFWSSGTFKSIIFGVEAPRAASMPFCDVFALALLDSGIDDCDCRGKDDVARVRMSKAGSLNGFGNPLTIRGSTLPFLEELTAS